jgi:type I restriction enzyme S subunit
MRVLQGEEKFISSVLITEKILKQVAAAKIGGAVPTLTETKIKDFDITVPQTEKEKQQIGAFFKNLDDLITLHQRE